MEPVKGFRDIEDSRKRNAIKKVIEETFSLYNFIPIETPIIEYEEFVKKDNENDEAVSDVFSLEDRGKRKLALRYEFTFQLKRLAKNKKLPYRVYQIGNVFRDEPIRGNRWRQFTQCDADIIGVELKEIAELLKMSSDILKKLNIKNTMYVNNRKLLNETLNEIGVLENDRKRVIREIDKLDKLPEKEIKENLKNYNAEIFLSILKKPENYFEKYDSYKDIIKLKKLCKLYGVNIKYSPFLARGLSYYNWIIFEIKSSIKETIAAGGNYLINNIQSSGISFGLDRLELLVKTKYEDRRILIISLNQDKKAIQLAKKLREMKIPSQIFYGKIGRALEYANSYNFSYVIFIGDEEVKKKKIKIRNMKTGKERLLNGYELIKAIL